MLFALLCGNEKNGCLSRNVFYHSKYARQELIRFYFGVETDYLLYWKSKTEIAAVAARSNAWFFCATCGYESSPSGKK